jgi:hypothetical protein
MAQPDIQVGRRTSNRRELCLLGIFLTSARAIQIEVLNLSLTGAQILTTRPPTTNAGVLICAHHRNSAQVVWHRKGVYGLSFESPISVDDLEEIVSQSGQIAAANSTSLGEMVPDWDSRKNQVDVAMLLANGNYEFWDNQAPSEMDPWKF